MNSTAPTVSYLNDSALQAANSHPLMMAAWHLADASANLAIRLQDAIEARLRSTADMP